jgi:hypothetical protein
MAMRVNFTVKGTRKSVWKSSCPGADPSKPSTHEDESNVDIDVTGTIQLVDEPGNPPPSPPPAGG